MALNLHLSALGRLADWLRVQYLEPIGVMLANAHGAYLCSLCSRAPFGGAIYLLISTVIGMLADCCMCSGKCPSRFLKVLLCYVTKICLFPSVILTSAPLCWVQ